MKTTFGILILCLLSACTSVQVANLNPRVEPPELRGDPGLRVAGSVVGAHRTVVTEDGSRRPPDTLHPSTARGAEFSAGANYSPIEPIEIGLEINTPGYDSGISTVIRWQLVGEGTRTAEEGNVPVTLYVRGGGSQSRASGDQKTTFGPGGYPWKGTVTGSYGHAGLSSGYRLDARTLLYGGIAIGQYWVRSEISQDATSDDSGGVYKSGMTGTGQTAGLGALFNWRKVQFYIGGEFTHIEYDHTSPMDGVYFNGGVYFTPF